MWNCQAFQTHPWTFHSEYQSGLQISPSHFHWGYLKEDKKFLLLRFYVKSVLVNMDHTVEKRWFYSYMKKNITWNKTNNQDKGWKGINRKCILKDYFFFFSIFILMHQINISQKNIPSSIHLHSKLVILSMRKYANTIHAQGILFPVKSQNIILLG